MYFWYDPSMEKDTQKYLYSDETNISEFLKSCKIVQSISRHHIGIKFSGIEFIENIRYLFWT